MSAELIYRTSSPAAEAWWTHASSMLTQQSELRRAFEAEMLATYGPAQIRYGEGVGKRLLYTNGATVIGIDSGHNEQPPPGSGWRLDSKDHFWKPALRTDEGKALKKRLAALTLYVLSAHVAEIGIPRMVWTDHHIWSPGIGHDDDPFVLYQTWGSGQCEKECLTEQAKHPDVEWTEVKRSEWYAREETKAKVDA